MNPVCVYVAKTSLYSVTDLAEVLHAQELLIFCANMPKWHKLVRPTREQQKFTRICSDTAGLFIGWKPGLIFNTSSIFWDMPI